MNISILFGRRGNNKTVGRAVVRANAPGGREADAERFSTLIKALTGREPKVYRMKDGKIMYRMLRGVSRRLQTLRRTSGHHREVAQGDEEEEIETDRCLQVLLFFRMSTSRGDIEAMKWKGL